MGDILPYSLVLCNLCLDCEGLLNIHCCAGQVIQA